MRTKEEKQLLKQLGISKSFRQYARRYGHHDVYSIQQIWKQADALQKEKVKVSVGTSSVQLQGEIICTS